MARDNLFARRSALLLSLGLVMTTQHVSADGKADMASRDARSGPVLVGYTNYVLPPATIANVAITNIGSNRRRCSNVEAEIRILGSTSDTASARAGDVSEVSLLEAHAVRLAPGQMGRIEFHQLSSEQETVFFVVTTKSRYKGCLLQAPVALSVPSDGAYIYVPGSPAAADNLPEPDFRDAVLDFALTGDSDF